MDQVWNHLLWLASEPRPAETPRLELCRQYCEQHLKKNGWYVTRQPFVAHDAISSGLNGINLVARRSPELPADDGQQRPVLILGAHLDSCPGTPGADDNASAVAALLQTAATLAAEFPADAWQQFPGDLELVVFDLEESGMLGAEHHAACCRAANRPVWGMVSLEMLGYCSHEPGSQAMPPELEGRYSDVGNFIGLVGNQNSSAMLQHFLKAFSSIKQLPCESLLVPDNGRPVPPTRLSDHSPFWDAGYPALMITDTSFMRNPHYHKATDTPDTLDSEFLNKVTDGVIEAVRLWLQTAGQA